MELNLALCRLKSKEPRDCIALCSGVLTREPNNVKALFRRAKAHVALNRLPAAEEDLARAAELAPEDDNIREELCALHEQMDDEEVLVCSSDGSSICSPSPDRDQLKKAVIAFRRGDARLVCVQASLTNFNASENTLTRLSTLESTSWFDYVLAGLEALGVRLRQTLRQELKVQKLKLR